MAKKPYTNTELSDKRCRSCGKRLKKNLLAKRPDADLCYRCFTGKKGKIK